MEIPSTVLKILDELRSSTHVQQNRSHAAYCLSAVKLNFLPRDIFLKNQLLAVPKF